MRKTFTTTIEESIQNKFKATCAEKGVKMNDVLETVMKEYAEGKFDLKVEYKTSIVEEKK